MVKALIYGAGAIGSFLAYLLHSSSGDENQPEENVALLGRKGHMQKIMEMGLEIESSGKSKRLHFQHCFSSLDELSSSDFYPELVIICVKSHSLASLSEELKRSGLLEERLSRSEFLILMNGMGNRDRLNLPEYPVFEGITSIGVVFSGDGKIELKGQGKTVLEEEISPQTKAFLEQRFESKGFEVEFAADFKVRQWNKLFANAVINPITALSGGKNGIVLSKVLQKTVEDIVEECVAAAALEGYRFEKNQVLDFVYSVAHQTCQNTSSMLQDVRCGKRTEIDSINGYVVDLAGKHGLVLPANRTLHSLVKCLEPEEKDNCATGIGASILDV